MNDGLGEGYLENLTQNSDEVDKVGSVNSRELACDLKKQFK